MVNEIIREVNLFQHYDWTPIERTKRVQIMKEAKNVNRQSLYDVSLDDFGGVDL